MSKRTPRTEARDLSTTAGAPQTRPEKASRRRASRDTDPATTSRSGSTFAQPSDEDIRMRAYMRYLERGGLHGLEFEDWLEAERELKGSK